VRGGGRPGSADGLAVQARFNAPCGLALDAATIFTWADSQQHDSADHIFGASNTVAGVATNPPGSVDGTNASFNLPSAWRGRKHHLYVCDFHNNESERSRLGNRWTVATLAGPRGDVYFGPITNIVAVTTNIPRFFPGSSLFRTIRARSPIRRHDHQCVDRHHQPPGVSPRLQRENSVVFWQTNLFNLPAAPPLLDGIAPNALFHQPSGLALDNSGNLYVGDGGTNGVRLVTPGGLVTTAFL